MALQNVNLTDSDFGFDSVTIVTVLLDGGTYSTYVTTTGVLEFADPLAVGGNYTVVIGPVTAVEGQHTNTATADGGYGGETYTDNDDANYIGAYGSICGKKYYDFNRNGWQDESEVNIAGFKIELYNSTDHLVATGFTDSEGEYCFDYLPLGDYTVKEVQPNSQWLNTTSPSIEVSLTFSEKISDDNDFGNICLGYGGGHTPGYWQNKNGFRTMNDGDTVEPELLLLSTLNLWNEDGTEFDPTTYQEFRTWLRDSRAVNMAYKLSVSLASMALNVEAGFVDPNALVYAPDVSGADSLGFISISALIDEANSMLGDGLTLPGDPNRAYQEILYWALDDANNNMNFLQSSPCPFSYATTKTRKNNRK